MKNLKLFLLNFVLYVYLTHVKFDWDELTPIAKVFLYLPWFIQAILVWLVCPIFLPEFFVKRTTIYKQFILLYNEALNKF